jgi:prepilin signal peptidase PulO-like enzyme (type II secretory pathway)
MTSSRTIAGLIGPTAVAFALSEWINLRVLWANTSPSVIYLNGSLLFVSGLAIVRAHNRWTGGWPVLVTLAGWFVMLAGLIRMFAPVYAQQEAENNTAVYGLLIVLFVVGVFLTSKAYGREDSRTAVQAGRN